MKEDLAGGKLPSDDFGENAAWWWIMILAMNLNSSMKRLADNVQDIVHRNNGGRSPGKAPGYGL
jgi:hypothetical protein